MPLCHMKSRSTGMLDIHLRVRHRASGPMAREINPLVKWVINREYQFSGVARPQFVTLQEHPHGAIAFNMKDTVITKVAITFPKGNKQGPPSRPQVPAAKTLAITPGDAKPRQVSALVGSLYELAVQPPPPPLTRVPLPPSLPPAFLPSLCSEPTLLQPPPMSSALPPPIPTLTPFPAPSVLLPPLPVSLPPPPPPPPVSSSLLPPLPCMPLLIPLPPAPQVQDSRPAAPSNPVDDPSSSNFLQGHIWSLDGLIDDLLWQRLEATEAAFSAMKKEYERKVLECKVLKRWVAVLEGVIGRLRGEWPLHPLCNHCPTVRRKHPDPSPGTRSRAHSRILPLKTRSHCVGLGKPGPGH